MIATVVLAASLPVWSAVLTASGASSSSSCTIAAAGDIAESGGDQEATAAVVESINPAAVLTLGDNAYESGSAQEFKDYYDPSWGKFKSITRPAPGNHEYQTSGAQGYLDYFGVPPYYAFDLCGWHLYSLNREIDGADRDKELSWLKSDLGTHRGQPMLAYWHEPRWTSGTKHGSDQGADDLWKAVVAGGVNVVLNGHEHSYERFAELDAEGKASAGGTREFIVGEGGSGDLSGFGSSMAASEKHIDGAHGVLAMNLRSDGYDWKLMQVGGKVADQGSQQLSSGGRSNDQGTQNDSTQSWQVGQQGQNQQGQQGQNQQGQNAWSRAVPAPAPGGAPAGSSFWWLPASQASYVKGTEPSTGFATAPELLVDAPDSARLISFVGFDLAGMPAGAGSVTGRLYLRATTDLTTGVDVHWSPNSWSQGTLTWSTQPVVDATPLGRIGPAHAGDWVSIDVSPVLRAGTAVSFALTGSAPGRAAGRFASDDSPSPPTLYLARIGGTRQ
jgi:hypothetical protein